MAWLDCRVLASYPGGNTHTIFVGEVLAADLGTAKDHRPLVYFHRRVRQLADLDEDD
jgi:flavin reductase (DIM6/NTAB) family NADH-FMN oxidoreductase RutF